MNLETFHEYFSVYVILLTLVSIAMAVGVRNVYINKMLDEPSKPLIAILKSGNTEQIQKTFNLSKSDMDSRYYESDKEHLVFEKLYPGSFDQANFEGFLFFIPIGCFVTVVVVGTVIPWTIMKRKVN